MPLMTIRWSSDTLHAVSFTEALAPLPPGAGGAKGGGGEGEGLGGGNGGGELGFVHAAELLPVAPASTATAELLSAML